MKKFLYIFLPLLAVVAVVWYFLKKTAKPVQTPGAQVTTNTAGKIAQWFPGWNGFTTASFNNATVLTRSVFGLLGTISNSFGTNDGGNSGGVSVGGSSSGGVNSSGSGAGLPLALFSNISSIWDRTFNRNNYSYSALNNYDVLNSSGRTSSSQSVDTGIIGSNYDNLDF